MLELFRLQTLLQEQPHRLRDSVRDCGILRESRMRPHFLFSTGALLYAPKLPQGDSMRGKAPHAFIYQRDRHAQDRLLFEQTGCLRH